MTILKGSDDLDLQMQWHYQKPLAKHGNRNLRAVLKRFFPPDKFAVIFQNLAVVLLDELAVIYMNLSVISSCIVQIVVSMCHNFDPNPVT